MPDDTIEIEKAYAENRRLWDAWAALHEHSAFYDVEGFRAGRCTLAAVEVEELGPVAGRELLHLQCHFGLDSLSWARRGARVTGVDFSPRAIEIARRLADDAALNEAEFICSDLHALPERLGGRQFDIVFTSGGVLCWLHDLEAWAAVIAAALRPVGVFYIREFHPLADALDADDAATEPVFTEPYFPRRAPMVFPCTGSYAAAEPGVERTSCEWPHSLGEIVSALAGAGLRIEFLHEFDYCTYRHRNFLVQGEDGLWRCEGVPGGLPLMFSLKASRT